MVMRTGQHQDDKIPER